MGIERLPGAFSDCEDKDPGSKDWDESISKPLLGDELGPQVERSPEMDPSLQMPDGSMQMGLMGRLDPMSGIDFPCH